MTETRALYKSNKYSRENQSSKYYVCGSKRHTYNLRLVINSRLCISLVAKLAVSGLKEKLEVDPWHIRPLVNKLSDAVPLRWETSLWPPDITVFFELNSHRAEPHLMDKTPMEITICTNSPLLNSTSTPLQITLMQFLSWQHLFKHSSIRNIVPFFHVSCCVPLSYDMVMGDGVAKSTGSGNSFR